MLPEADGEHLATLVPHHSVSENQSFRKRVIEVIRFVIMEWSAEKTIEFCNDYQKRPLLWKASHIDYKNRVKRRDAIQELALLYGMDEKGVLNKIKSLRSYYHREQLNLKKKITKSGSSGDGTFTSSWFAYKHIQFIGGEDTETTGRDTMGLDNALVSL